MGWVEIQLSGISASSGVDDGEMGTLLPHPFSVVATVGETPLPIAENALR